MTKCLKVLGLFSFFVFFAAKASEEKSTCDSSLIGIYELVGERAQQCPVETKFQLKLRIASEALPSALVFQHITDGYGVTEASELVTLKDGPNKNKNHGTTVTDDFEFIQYSSQTISRCYAAQQNYRTELYRKDDDKLKRSLYVEEYALYREVDQKEYLRISGVQHMDIADPTKQVSWECKYEKKSSEVYLGNYPSGNGVPEKLEFPPEFL